MKFHLAADELKVDEPLGRSVSKLRDELITIQQEKQLWLQNNKNRNSEGFTPPNFLIGKSRSRMPAVRADNEKYYTRVTMDNETFLLYTRDLKESTKPKWMVRLYQEHLCPLIHQLDPLWAGKHNELVAQVAFMSSGDVVDEHTDELDKMVQYGIIFGGKVGYDGGVLETYQAPDKSDLIRVGEETKNYVVQLDGRFPHRVTPVTRGLRICVYFFKPYDRRLTTQAPLVWPPASFNLPPLQPESTRKAGSAQGREVELLNQEVGTTSRRANNDETVSPKASILPTEKKRKAIKRDNQRQKELRKKKRFKKRAKAPVEQAAGYLNACGIEKVSGTLRSCLHDAVINAARRIGITVDKDMLYKEQRPFETKDTKLESILKAPIVRDNVNILFEGGQELYHGGKRDLAFNLLRRKNDGVYVVAATIDSACTTRRQTAYATTTSQQAFVYDSHHTEADKPSCWGAIIDNRSNVPTPCLEDTDRKSRETVQAALDSFFGGRVQFKQVYRVHAKGGL